MPGIFPNIPMANEPEQKTMNESKEQSPQTDPGSKPTTMRLSWRPTSLPWIDMLAVKLPIR